MEDVLVFSVADINEGLKDLICGMMEKDPLRRLDLAACLEHPWLQSEPRIEGHALNIASIRTLPLHSAYSKVEVTHEDIFSSVREILQPESSFELEDDENELLHLNDKNVVQAERSSKDASSDVTDDLYSDVSSGEEDIMKTLDLQQAQICRSPGIPDIILNKEVSCISGMHSSRTFRASSATAKGRRPTQEDIIEVILSFNSRSKECKSMLAVYDGHSGSNCAYLLKQELGAELNRSFCQDDKQLRCWINETFKMVDVRICEKLRRVDDASGSTALIALIDSQEIIIANVGDSLSLLYGKEIGLRILNDQHRVNNIREKDRLLSEKAIIQNNRVNGMLAITRSFGDCRHKHENGAKGSIDPIPDVFFHERTVDDELLVLGSDGIFDVLSPIDVVKLIKYKLIMTKDLDEAANFIVEKALEHGSNDNVSVIIVVLNNS